MCFTIFGAGFGDEMWFMNYEDDHSESVKVVNNEKYSVSKRDDIMKNISEEDNKMKVYIEDIKFICKRGRLLSGTPPSLN